MADELTGPVSQSSAVKLTLLMGVITYLECTATTGRKPRLQPTHLRPVPLVLKTEEQYRPDTERPRYLSYTAFCLITAVARWRIRFLGMSLRDENKEGIQILVKREGLSRI
ncbi:hypothetical protein ElyMa_002083500 [Elysia marginata]|uniref:Uncharacterized protein n=1 Tax=Elysia marginata TaxID=1093978 RepID=A0AAV4FC79_9GAST|nr:hypothetical protein ElyMa_002083500 [Elysia marginata]